jgi:hypothetical protein
VARTVRDTNLEKAAARARLEARGKPYWRVLESGLHLGYRRTKAGGGSWTARRFLGERKYAEHGLGFADDLQEADGVTVLTFSDAQGKARDWWKAAERAELGLAPFGGPYTVAMALDAYFTDRERRGSKGEGSRRRAFAHLTGYRRRGTPEADDQKDSRLAHRPCDRTQARPHRPDREESPKGSPCRH